MSRGLHPRQIEAFRAVMETGSISRAANRLLVSQPAVSKLIQHLEHDTKLTLFLRTGGRVMPTADAVLLHEEVERVYRGLEYLERFVKDLHSLRGSKLTIGVMPALSTGFIQDVVAEFNAKHELSRVAIRARNTAALIDWLLAGIVDLAITTKRVEHAEIERVELDQREVACVVPAGHPFARRAVIHATDLNDEPFIALAPEYGFEIEAILTANDIRPKQTFQAQSAPTICVMVARGMGITLFNPLYAIGFADKLVCRPFKPTITSTIYVLRPRHRHRSEALSRFLEVTEETIAARYPHVHPSS